MSDEMGTFRINVEIENPVTPGRRARQDNYAGGTSATDDVAFGEPRDLVILGSRSLEGLNLRIDPAHKTLVDAGPAPAAAAC